VLKKYFLQAPTCIARSILWWHYNYPRTWPANFNGQVLEVGVASEVLIII